RTAMKATTRRRPLIIDPHDASKAEPGGCCSARPAAASTARPLTTAVVDNDLKAANLMRLRRIEGQIRGIARMIEEDRYCADVLGQMAAAQAALRAVGRELMRHHLKHCVPDALAKGRSEEVYDELIDLMYKNAQ